ncbi:MAG: hypothetical protein GX417_01010 [Clostridiales bacterium]|nr:hypothetical protein [Clostridiales bacterium]
MSAKNLFSTSGKYYTQNGAATLNSCGISSAGKGVTIAFSGLADSPERMNLWYLRAPGESATDYLYFKDIVDIRTCAINQGAAQKAVRLTGKNGELYILEVKTPALARDLADKLNAIGKEYLEANREFAEKLPLPEPDDAQVTVPTVEPAVSAGDRKKKALHVLGIVMQTIGYLLLAGLISAFFNDGGNTDWTGVGFGILALAALIIGGTVLTKKN